MRPHCLVHSCAQLDKRVLNSPTCSQNPLAVAVSYPFLRAMKLHTSVLFRSIDPLAVLDVCAFLHCDIRASLRDCGAQLLLCICDAGFQGTANCVLETSLLSLLKHLSRARWSVCSAVIEHTLVGSA